MIVCECDASTRVKISIGFEVLVEGKEEQIGSGRGLRQCMVELKQRYAAAKENSSNMI